MLSSREKTLVSVAAIAVTLMLFWLLILNPILSGHDKLTRLTQEKQTELLLMQRQSVLIKKLQQQASGSQTSKIKGNPQQLIEVALQDQGLKPTLQRMQSRGTRKVSLSLKEAEADKVMRFIGDLEKKYGLVNTQMVLAKAKVIGTVNVRLTVEKK